MTRVEKILTRARDTLGDPDKTRWSDERLLRLLDEGQKDLCRRAKLLRAKAEFIVFDGKGYYDMPEDFLLLDKVTINDMPVPLIGHTDLDHKVAKWETLTGAVQNVVFDKQLRGKIRLFPIPDYKNGNILQVVPSYNSYLYGKVREPYGVIANMAQASQFTGSQYGVTTSITGIFQWQEDFDLPRVVVKDYKMSSRYGVTSQIIIDSTPDYTVDPEFGCVTSITGFSSDVYGAITDVQGTDYNIQFTSVTGEGVAFNIFENFGYFTHFKNRGDITDWCDGKLNSPYGYTADIESLDRKDVVFESAFGLATSITYIRNNMVVFYIKKPKDITKLDSVIEVDDAFDTALKYYVVGMAFRDDVDTQNRALGSEELSLYERELQTAIREDTLDFTHNNNVQYEVKYNGGGFIYDN